jgi:hypothetical protein
MRDVSRHIKRLARADDTFLPVEGEVRFALGNDEALLLVRVDVLGDRAARSAAPVEAEDVLADVCELDLFTGDGVEDRSETGQQPGCLRERRPGRPYR